MGDAQSRNTAKRSNRDYYQVELVPFDDGTMYISITTIASSHINEARRNDATERAIVSRTEDALHMIRLTVNNAKAGRRD